MEKLSLKKTGNILLYSLADEITKKIAWLLEIVYLLLNMELILT